MPLVVVSGRPCTGKTAFSAALVDYLRRRGKGDAVSPVALVNDESLTVSKATGYASA